MKTSSEHHHRGIDHTVTLDSLRILGPSPTCTKKEQFFNFWSANLEMQLGVEKKNLKNVGGGF